ncbi:LOW QUALITY PROTEIN: hypothetical protein U9M48_044920 [Paspalum notatum var. saurae]|uniref:Reverse transcriptase domain-containing protein n=1 Tax=Paspalum notatum var. saurae TaxID=547442 RepID=A0AAQ3XJY7_PASNO
MPTGCHISKSLKAALSRCTAKEPRSLDHDADELRLLRARQAVRFISAGAGKFWASESDDEADLGGSLVMLPRRDTTATVAITEKARAIGQSSSNVSSVEFGGRGAWQAPAKYSPVFTAIEIAALEEAVERSATTASYFAQTFGRRFALAGVAVCRRGRGACVSQTVIRNLIDGKRPGAGLASPKESDMGQAVSFSKPNRRLISPIIVHLPEQLAPPKLSAAPAPLRRAVLTVAAADYAEAVMAGGHGGRRGRFDWSGAPWMGDAFIATHTDKRRSGGILLGVDLEVFDIGAIAEGDFYVKFTLRSKHDDFKFVLYTVYGPAQQQNKQAFLAEMVNTCSKETLPIKSPGVFDFKWPNLFNAVIDSLDLKEIVMSGRQFTWAGPGKDPTFEKLDIVLVSTDWEIKYPLSTRRRTQSHSNSFYAGRNIMEGVVILHETVHELHTKNRDGIILKIDFEKAYDKVKWPYPLQTLRMKGFS